MPDDEFYANVNPEIGFRFVTAYLMGAKMNERMEKRR
jgi:hypothetical protein